MAILEILAQKSNPVAKNKLGPNKNRGTCWIKTKNDIQLSSRISYVVNMRKATSLTDVKKGFLLVTGCYEISCHTKGIV